MNSTDKVKVKRRPIRKTPYEWYVDEMKKLNIDRVLTKDEYRALHKNDANKLTPYQRYVIRATELNVGTILKEGNYNETIKLNEEKGRKINDWILARWQFQGKKTDKQIDAMWRAAQLKNPELTREQFIRERGWKAVDKVAEDLYAEIVASEDYQRIEAQIEKLEDKAKEEDLDLIDSERLRKLKEDKYTILHQISQQVYGSD